MREWLGGEEEDEEKSGREGEDEYGGRKGREEGELKGDIDEWFWERWKGEGDIKGGGEGGRERERED